MLSICFFTVSFTQAKLSEYSSIIKGAEFSARDRVKLSDRKFQLFIPIFYGADFFSAFARRRDNRLYMKRITEKRAGFGDSPPGCQIFELIDKDIFLAGINGSFCKCDNRIRITGSG